MGNALRNPGDVTRLDVMALAIDLRDRAAFEQQLKSIGLDAASIYVPHPMQNRSTAELHAFAERSIDEILAAVVRQ